VVKNRLHLDIHVSGSCSDPLAIRTRRVDAKPGGWRLSGPRSPEPWARKASITTRGD